MLQIEKVSVKVVELHVRNNMYCTFPLGNKLLGRWGNVGPSPALWSWYDMSSSGDFMAGLACLNVSDTVSANLSFSLSPHTRLCTITNCCYEQFPPDLTILVKAQLCLHNPLLFFSFLPLFSAFFRCPRIEKHIFGLLSMLAANRSQYFCPWVSCVTCPLNYFPLLTFLTASGGLPEQSDYCAYPHMLWHARELQLYPASYMKVWGQNWIRLSTDKITRGFKNF